MDTFQILILSQVVLSMQLPFTLIPLVLLCRNRRIMEEFRSGNKEFVAAVGISAIVIALNL